MRDHVGHQICHVVRDDVVAPPDQGQGAGGRDEPEAGARAGSVGELARQAPETVAGRRPGGQHKAHRVLRDGVVDEDVGGGVL